MLGAQQYRSGAQLSYEYNYNAVNIMHTNTTQTLPCSITLYSSVNAVTSESQ